MQWKVNIIIYRNVIKEMSEECRMIAYNLPGYGYSDAPDNFK